MGAMHEAPHKAAAATQPPKPSLPYVYSLLATWIVLSISLVLLNKHLLYFAGFQFPITLAFWHMAAATAMTLVAVHVFKVADPVIDQDWRFYVQFAYIGALFALSLTLGMAAFMFLDVTTMQMIKVAAPATSFVVGMLLGVEHYSHTYALKVAIVCCGVALASYGDVSFNAFGAALQLASICADALRCTLLQMSQQRRALRLSPIVTLYYVAPSTLVALWGPMWLLELRSLERHFGELAHAMPLVLASGVLACLLNVTVFAFIGATSALTSNMTGVLKDWIIIVIAMVCYHVPVSFLQIAGYLVALSGLAWYQYDKIVKPARVIGAAQCEQAQDHEAQGKQQAQQQLPMDDLMAAADQQRWQRPQSQHKK